jgi:hypothetical protein
MGRVASPSNMVYPDRTTIRCQVLHMKCESRQICPTQRPFPNNSMSELLSRMNHHIGRYWMKVRWLIENWAKITKNRAFEMMNDRSVIFEILMKNRGSCQFRWPFALLIEKHRIVKRSCEFDFWNWRCGLPSEMDCFKTRTQNLRHDDRKRKGDREEISTRHFSIS